MFFTFPPQKKPTRRDSPTDRLQRKVSTLFAQFFHHGVHPFFVAGHEKDLFLLRDRIRVEDRGVLAFLHPEDFTPRVTAGIVPPDKHRHQFRRLALMIQPRTGIDDRPAAADRFFADPLRQLLTGGTAAQQTRCTHHQ